MKVKRESEVAQSCPTPSDPMDCRLPDSSIHGIFQARVLEWGAIAFSVYTIYYVLSHFPKEWVNLTQMTIISTTVGKSSLEEME